MKSHGARGRLFHNHGRSVNGFNRTAFVIGSLEPTAIGPSRTSTESEPVATEVRDRMALLEALQVNTTRSWPSIRRRERAS